MKVGLNVSSARALSRCSASAFVLPYGVTGFISASSPTATEPAAPYKLQEEANTNRSTPAALATVARCTVPFRLMS